jgi:hypothetical protein
MQRDWPLALRPVLDATANVLLDGLLPAQAPQRLVALEAQAARVRATASGMPQATQEELLLLLSLLATTAGRRLLAGLRSPWLQASPAAVRHALEHMRASDWSLRRQAYQGLRDLQLAAWTAEPANWQALGYPGPAAL